MDPNTRNYVVKPVVAGGLAATATALWRPDWVAEIPGYGSYSLPLVVGGLIAGMSVAAAYMNDKVFDHIPGINVFEAPAHTAVNVAAIGGGAAIVENFISPGILDDLPVSETLVMAGLAEVGSTYLVDQLLAPMVQKWSAP